MHTAVTITALKLAHMGRYVFPTGQDKKPALKDWPNQSSINSHQLAKWFNKKPQPNIAVVTGQKSGFFCLDVDGEKGKRSLKKLEAAYSALKMLCVAQTPSGGLHYYFAMPLQDVRNSASKLGPGLDIRANGGYVLVPPSQIINRKGEKASYKWLTETTLLHGELPAAPDWLLRLIIQKDERPQDNQKTNYLATNTRYGQKSLQNACAIIQRSQEGLRNDTLNRAAFSIWRLVAGGEITELAAESELFAAARSCGLSDKEINATMLSARKKALIQPKSAPDIHHTGDKLTLNQVAIEELKNKIFLKSPPLEVFPPKIQKMLKEAAVAFKRLPIEVPIVALLALLTACVGRCRVVSVKNGWEEAGNLYLGIVAGSGLGKSPCFKEFLKPLWKHEINKKAEWDNAMASYNYQMEERRQIKDKACLGDSPIKPIRNQYIIEDITTEAIGNILSDNPRGLLWYSDELSSIILNLDRYSNAKGGTKARLLSTYDGSPWKTSRRDNEKDQVIPSAVLSIVGTVQPRILKELFNQTDALSGFLPRFIFILAKRTCPALLEDELFTGQEILQKITNNILSWKMQFKDGLWQPYKIKLAPEAYAAYEKWHNETTTEAWKESEVAATISAKLVTQVIRLALLLHCLKAALDDDNGLSDISLVTMQQAIMLGDWIREQQKQVWLALNIENTTTKTPLEEAIILSALEFEEQLELNQWRVSNDDFYHAVNKKLSEQIDPSFIGRVASKMGVKSVYYDRKRGKEFSKDILKEFKLNFYL